MDTRKKQTEQSTSTGPAATRKPLTVKKDTLKDLEPETRNAAQVKGGVPIKYGTDCGVTD